MLLREIFPEIFKKDFKRGDYCVLNVYEFFKTTNYLLSSKSKNLSKHKYRPIILFEVKKESIKFLATTTNLFTRNKRPKISLKDCKIFKEKQECFGLDLKRNYVWIFAKKTSKSKRYRVFYTVDIYTIKFLKSKNLFKVCGNCEKILQEIENKIRNFGDIL